MRSCTSKPHQLLDARQSTPTDFELRELLDQLIEFQHGSHVQTLLSFLNKPNFQRFTT